MTTGPQGWPLPTLLLDGKGLQDVDAGVLGLHAHVHRAGEQRNKRQGGSDSHPHEARVRNGRHQTPVLHLSGCVNTGTLLDLSCLFAHL